MAAASSFPLWLPFLAMILLAVLVFGDFRARTCILAMGLCIGVSDGVAVNLLKDAVGRPRPAQSQDGVRCIDLAKASPRFLALGKPLAVELSHAGIQPLRGASFPSGHASNNFALATVLAVFYRRWGWIAFLPASLVAYSRCYVGSHWPSDVVISALLGAGISLLVLAAIGWMWEHFGSRFAPTWHRRQPSLFAQ